jgi:pimeloyl-ACP methyl ester carboxylesterase
VRSRLDEPGPVPTNPTKDIIMTPSHAVQPSAEGNEAIRPFHVNIPENDLVDAIPVAVSVFPDEIYAAPRSWVERAYPRLLRYNRLPKGGHFAAWEQPDAFVKDLRASFRTVR